MPQPPAQSQQESQALELTSTALLAEYHAIRDASLARESIMGSLENFMMVVLSAAIVTLPTLIKDQHFLLLPVVALILSVIALARRHQAYVHDDLASYEREVLRPQVVALIQHVHISQQLSEITNRLWQWQSFFQRRQSQGRLLVKLTRTWISYGLEPLFVLSSLGFLLLFVYYRGIANWTIPEVIAFVLAVFFSLWIALLFAWSLAGSLIFGMKKRAAIHEQPGD